MYEIDSSLQKRFRISERLRLNFRAAAYNLLNHPVFKNPSSAIGSLTGNPPAVSGSFGRITSIINTGAVGTGAPRRIEFMFRAEFAYANPMPGAQGFALRCARTIGLSRRRPGQRRLFSRY